MINNKTGNRLPETIAEMQTKLNNLQRTSGGDETVRKHQIHRTAVALRAFRRVQNAEVR